MAEFPDTTTGIVDSSGYPDANNVPTAPYDPTNQQDDGFGYYMFLNDQKQRIGTGLRFWAGYPTTQQPVALASSWIYDFFSNSVWPTSFWSNPVRSVLVAGDQVPAPQTRARHRYPDPVNARANLAVPATRHLSYEITHPPTQPGGARERVGWLFIKDQAASEITIAVKLALIDHGRPFHMSLAECHFQHKPNGPYDMTGLWGETLTRV